MTAPVMTVHVKNVIISRALFIPMLQIKGVQIYKYFPYEVLRLRYNHCRAEIIC